MKTFELGDVFLGVRSNRVDALEMLQSIIPRHVLEIDGAHPNVSLLFGEKNEHGAPVHQLNRSGKSLIYTTSMGRIIRGTLQQLGAYLRRPEYLIPLNAQVLVREGKAVLVHPSASYVFRWEAQLERLGFLRADVPTANIDVNTGMIQLAPPALDMDQGALEDLNSEYPFDEREIPINEPVELPVSHWIVAGAQMPETLPRTKGGLLVALAEHSTDHRLSRRERVEGLATLIETTQVLFTDDRNNFNTLKDVLASL